MSSIVVSGNTSGAVTLTVPDVAGTNTVTVPAATGTMIYKDSNGTTTLNGNSGQNPLVVQNNGTEAIRVNSVGSMLLNYSGATITADPQGIGLASPANTLLQYYLIKSTQVEGHFGFKSGSDSNLYVGTAGGTTGVGSYGTYQTNTGNSWNAVSDETLKTDLKPILDGLNKVNSLRAVTGRYKIDPKDKSRSFLIAQDVQKVLPEAVSIADYEKNTLGLSYTDVIPLLVAAIKELKAEIDILKAGK